MSFSDLAGFIVLFSSIFCEFPVRVGSSALVKSYLSISV